jgi:hypothetical protein
MISLLSVLIAVVPGIGKTPPMWREVERHGTVQWYGTGGNFIRRQVG